MNRLTCYRKLWCVCFRLLLLSLLAMGFAFAFTQSTQAATFTIPCTDGVGDVGALRSVIATVGSNGETDTIELVANCTYKLSYADHPGLIIYPDGGRLLTINGNGATIDGDTNYRKDILYIEQDAVVEINRLTVMGSHYRVANVYLDSFGFAIRNGGTLTLNASTITKNKGGTLGVLFQWGEATGALTLNNSTVSGNHGTGIEVQSTVILNNSTVINNGGAIRAIDLRIRGSGKPQVFLNNSIVDECEVDEGFPADMRARHTMMSEEQNCIQHGVDGNIVIADQFGIELSPLTGNPAYHPLPPGSPAINVGDDSLVPAWMTTDQAGNPRIAGVNLPVDIGAMEYQGFPRTAIIGAATSNIQEGIPVRVTFYRTQPTDDLMSVYFTVSTTGADQVEVHDTQGNLLNGRVTMPAGASSVDVMLTALADGIAETNEPIVVTMSDTPQYDLGTPPAATINVLANDFGVTNLNDFNGIGASAAAREGTLRQALENARNLPSDDIITFLNVEGTITLSGGPLSINGGGGLTVEGAGITLNGNNVVVPLSIGEDVSGVINGLTITGGNGGGLINNGEVTLNNVIISNNRSGFGLGDFYGGGLLNFGTLTINRGLISNNVAQNGGGGILNGGTLTLYHSTVSGNQAGDNGGGINNGNNGVITLINSTVSGNRVTGSSGEGGGAILNRNSLSLIQTTVSNNQSTLAPGGIRSYGSLTIQNSIVANSGNGDCINSDTNTIAYSLLEGGGCGISNGVNGNLTGDPNLGPLVGHPGFHLLNLPSLAIDAGNNSLLPPEITEDQSGNQRVFPTAGMVDMGAIEFGQIAVTVVAAAATANEGSTTHFTFARTGFIDEPLVVHFAPGDAAGADDYILSIAGTPLTEDQVTIPADAATLDIELTIVDDIAAEADETVQLTVLDTVDYNLGTPSVAAVKIPANDLVVTTLNDPEPPTSPNDWSGTLRQALRNADAFPSDDTITFTVAGRIKLNGTALQVGWNGRITIEGAGITLDGAGRSAILHLKGARGVFNNLTITGGFDHYGGGILAMSQDLTINNSLLYGNQALHAGGAIYHEGTLTINNSTIRNNTAEDGTGGGLFSYGTVTLNNSTVSNNVSSDAGGIAQWEGSLTINHSTITANHSFSTPGNGADGLEIIYATLRIHNSIIAGNESYSYPHVNCKAVVATVTVRNSLFGPGSCGATNGVDGNIVVEPAAPILATLTGYPGYYPLLAGSPAINAGDNELIPAGMTTDQAGNPRIIDEIVDMGAVEYDPIDNVAPVIRVNAAQVTVAEGAQALNIGTVNDADNDPITLSASGGTVVDNQDGTWSWRFDTTDGPADNQTVTITASDDSQASNSVNFELTVHNVAPIIAEVSNDGPILVGDSTTITVNASDPAGAADPLRYEFDCNNDGTFEVIPQAEPTASCPFASVGEFIIPVRVTDDDGGLAPDSTVVTVNALPDTTPPDTLIDTMPADPSDSSEASFTFSGSDDVTEAEALTFECQLNGGGFTSCTSPPNYSGLADGVYTFQVRAVDEEGNSDPTPASYTWTIDVIPDGEWIGECVGYQVYLHEGVYSARGWGGNILVGTATQNNLTGTAGNDLILGLGGNDILNGKAGDDVICGGEGNDLIYGELGTDYLDGGNHNDVLNGGTGDYDVLIGGDGNDTLLDPDGVAELQGGPGNEQINFSLHSGWRDEAGEPHFVGYFAAGLGNDTVTFGILGSETFTIDITGDEWADMEDEGTADTIRFAGRVDQANAQFRKFEGQVIIATSELPLITDESGFEFWADVSVAEQPDAALTYHLYLSMVSN